MMRERPNFPATRPRLMWINAAAVPVGHDVSHEAPLRSDDRGRGCAAPGLATKKMNDGLGFIGGLLTGAAGSLHCLGICGGIASSLFLASGGGIRFPAANAIAIQLGRVATYAVLGALAGSGGGALAILMHFSGAQQLLRILASSTLVLTGLSVVGVVPGPGRRIVTALAPKSACRSPSPYRATFRPVALGMAWGLAPCGMVYSALLTAAFAGSPAGGAVFMLGFGTATVPALAIALVGSAGAATRFRGAARALKNPLGWSLVTVGLLSVAEPAAAIGALCLGSRG